MDKVLLRGCLGEWKTDTVAWQRQELTDVPHHEVEVGSLSVAVSSPPAVFSCSGAGSLLDLTRVEVLPSEKARGARESLR